MALEIEPRKKVLIYGGGTVEHLASHMAVCAPAYGKAAKDLLWLCRPVFNHSLVETRLTKMAGGADMETSEDVAKDVAAAVEDQRTKVIFMTTAFCDFIPLWGERLFEDKVYPSKFQRLDSRTTRALGIKCVAAEKILPRIREKRKDIFLVGFKTTLGRTGQEMFERGLRLCKEAHCNLVLVNDVARRVNMIVTPEEAVYAETEDRQEALRELVMMTYYRSQLTFTRSTVVDGKPVAWDSDIVPHALRTVVEHCINGQAYKPFGGATVGHFAARLSETEFITSIRRSNFNNLKQTGMVYVRTDGPDTVLAYGAKPSVGGQSQRIVFHDHPGMDCIVHFHCPMRPDAPDKIPALSQREVECGSHQCGANTSAGLAQFGSLKAVMLDKHGPNIVFPKDIDPGEVIAFIERNFDLSQKTGGYNI